MDFLKILDREQCLQEDRTRLWLEVMPNLIFLYSSPTPPPESSSGILDYVLGFIIKEHLRSE